MSDGTTAYEYGEAYRAILESQRGNGKPLRAEDRAYCPTCGKLVAAVVIINARRWLYTVGGRVGSHGQHIDALESEVRQWSARAGDADARGDYWLAERHAVVAAEREAERERVAEAGDRRVIGSQVVSLEFVTSADFEEAPCRGCRRNVPITMDARKYVRHDAVNGEE